jgi:uncharacterized protein YxeA
MERDKKIILIIVVAVVVLLVAGVVGGYFLLTSSDSSNTNQNQSVVQNTNTTTNTNSDIEENTNQTSAVTAGEVTVEGMVFLKGYKTPSESYGISTTDGHEIGLGKYDTMKEQFRAYIGDRVKVTFERICKSTNEDCCLTLFYYCGTVKSWEPVENTNS